MAETLAKLFRHAISYDKRDAILTKQDLLTDRSGRFEPISSRELYRRVAKLQLALGRVGLGKGDRCALLSENRWEWAVSDFAMMTSGMISVPLYPTLTADQLHYMLEHSESRVVLVSSAEQLAKVQSIWPTLPKLEGVAVFDNVSSDDERVVSVQNLIGTEPLDAGYVGRVSGRVDGEGLLRPGFGEVESRAVREADAQCNGSLTGTDDRARQSVVPTEPSRLREVEDQVQRGSSVRLCFDVDELAVARHRQHRRADERIQRRVVGLEGCDVCHRRA